MKPHFCAKLKGSRSSFDIFLFHNCFAQKKNTKLSDFQKQLVNGDAPMPIFTGVLVKPDVPAFSYHGMIVYTTRL